MSVCVTMHVTHPKSHCRHQGGNAAVHCEAKHVGLSVKELWVDGPLVKWSISREIDPDGPHPHTHGKVLKKALPAKWDNAHCRGRATAKMGGVRNRDAKMKANKVFRCVHHSMQATQLQGSHCCDVSHTSGYCTCCCSSAGGGGTKGPAVVDKRGQEQQCPYCEKTYTQVGLAKHAAGANKLQNNRLPRGL